MRLLGELVDGDVRFGTHVHTGAALAVQVVQALKTFLQSNTQFRAHCS